MLGSSAQVRRAAHQRGERLTQAEVNERYGDDLAQYVICVNSKRCIDVRDTNSSAVRFANDAHGTRLRGEYLVASGSGIPKDREVLVSYGRDYWRSG
jgi:hypothetical protein